MDVHTESIFKEYCPIKLLRRLSHEDKTFLFRVLMLASVGCSNVLFFSHKEVKNETSLCFHGCVSIEHTIR